MKIHEYQARDLFEQYNVPVSSGKVFESLDGVQEYVEKLNGPVVVKAQIHAGGRGKGGGVKYSPSLDEALNNAKNILHMNLVTHQTGPEGKKVNKILIVPAVDIKKEYYLAITVDRATQRAFIIASTEGGVDIEDVAQNNPDAIQKFAINAELGIWPYLCRKVAKALELPPQASKQLAKSLVGLYKMFIEKDCSVVEINPLVLTCDDNLQAIDGKVNFDENALYRQQDILALRDITEEEPLEVEASEHDLNYIKLDGNVACMVNGAGLAMSTMDCIKMFGGTPANFLDIGGTASKERVTKAFEILLSDANVKGVLINIFGGIVRCDLVAQGVVAAIQSLKEINLPIVIRLSGTNSELGKNILEESKLNFIVADNLNDAAQKIVQEVE